MAPASPPDGDIVVQRPEQSAQLILLLHGVGSQAASMVPLGQQLASAFPQAMVVSVQGPWPSDLQQGFQWFSVLGITEDNRQARVHAAMPAFVARIAHWQQQAGLGAEATALVGFSQGAIMALESTQLGESGASAAPAGRVVALAGRFATLPLDDRYRGSVHLLHGKSDGVISYELAIVAAHRLKALGVDFTAEVRPGIGHEVPPELGELVVQRLQNHISHHLMQEGSRADSSGTVH